MPIIHEVEQWSDEYVKLHHGKPTSSNFSKIITGSGKPSDSLNKYALELATELFVGGALDDGFSGNKYTERGKEMEPVSNADYQMLKQVVIEPVGFITDDLLRWGTSTDGLIGDDGVVEFKNLIATEMAKALLYWKKHQKPEPKYIPQAQGELFIAERKWCDLVLYHPQFEMIIIRIYPDKEYHQTLALQLNKCIAERNNILKKLKA